MEYQDFVFSKQENEDVSYGQQAVRLSEEFERESRRYSRRFTEEEEVKIR